MPADRHEWVGGGNSAPQLLAEISTWMTTTWVAWREPVWNEGPFDEAAGQVWPTARPRPDGW